MRASHLILSLIALTIVGCAREQMSVPVAKIPAREIASPPSAALAFTPRVVLATADDLDLDRTGRGTYATAGYESQVVSETYVRQDDRMRMDRFGDEGTFERRAISTTVTVRQR